MYVCVIWTARHVTTSTCLIHWRCSNVCYSVCRQQPHVTQLQVTLDEPLQHDKGVVANCDAADITP